MVPAVAILAAAAAVAPIQDAVELRLGEALQVVQRADETRTFHITLEAGKAYLLEAEQRELDLIIEITGPDGVSRAFDSPLLRYASERILIAPDSPGSYLISLSTSEHKGGQLRFAVRILEFNLNSESAPQMRDALAEETIAAEATHAGGLENWRRAANAYESAAKNWGDLGTPSAQARVRLGLARLQYLHLSDWPSVFREAKLAAGLYEELGDRGLFASALHLWGAALVEAASETRNPTIGSNSTPEAEALFDEALAHFTAAERIKNELGESYEHARIINDIGLMHHVRGNWSAARQRYKEAAQAFQVANEWAGELRATANLATVDYSQGRLAQALEEYGRVLELIRPGELPVLRGNLLSNMATAQQALGDVDRALATYSQALSLFEEHESLSGRGRVLSGIGVTYFSIGELDLALEYLGRALPIRREARDGPGQVSTLLYLGSLYLAEGEFERAIDAHKEAASLAASPRERARAEVNLGRDFAAAGRNEEAMRMLEVARDTAAEAATPVVAADALLERGRLLVADGRPSDAALELDQALAIYEELGWTTGEAQSLHQLARAAFDAGTLERAADYAKASIERTEQLRNLIANPELRASFLAKQRDHYGLFVDIAMELAFQGPPAERHGWLAQALEMSERARMRAMLELMQEVANGLAHTADIDLTKKRMELYQELAGLRFRQHRMLEKAHDPEGMTEVGAALNRVETEIKLVESELRRRDPRYAALATPKTLDLPGMQAVLDDDSMLLQYETGEKRSWLFVVTTDNVVAHPLPPREGLESKSRRAYELIQTLDANPAVRKELGTILRELSKSLIEPAQPLKPRVVVAADGALHYLPFAALPIAGQGAEVDPLVAHHEFVSLPSISVLAAQRELLSGRPSPPMTVAIFADPVFQVDDPRFEKPQQMESNGITDTQPMRSGRLSETTLLRLPATADEADAIAVLVPSDQRLVATGFEANRSAVLGIDLSVFRVLHFATHALIDDRYPALSALALSQYDNQREAVNGMLRLHDVYNLDLNANLVTLSACETAGGRELRGEGLIGLTRAFLHAGGRSVVATLWQVPDRATAALMGRFYENQLLSGLSPPAAIRQAQLSVKTARSWRDPYYWAGFVAYGEWQTTINGGSGITDETRN